jgi:Lrp/AsnC family leucine-responsive transcriptional regulator
MAKTSTSNQNPRLDAIDLRLLELLRGDGRMSVSGLARAAHVSRATGYARLNKLMELGVLTGYTVQVDTARAGLDVTAIILIAAHQIEDNALETSVRSFPEVEYFALLAGQFDAMAIVRTPDMLTLRNVVLRRFQRLREVRSTQTLIVLDEPLHHPFVLPQQDSKPS